MDNVEGNSGEPNLNLPPDQDELSQPDDQGAFQMNAPGKEYSEFQFMEAIENQSTEPTSDHNHVDGLDESGDQGADIEPDRSRGIYDEEEDPEEDNSDVAVDYNPNNFNEEENQENEVEAAAMVAEKRWPGWPGESVFRMLVPAQKVGGIIGRKGEFVKRIVEETKARVKILDAPPGTSERVVMVSAKEELDAFLPPAVDGLLRVHKHVIDGLDGDSPQTSGLTTKFSTRLLVPASQAGSLIGKQGGTVKSIQESAGCMVKVLGIEDLPVFALQDDRVVEVTGQPSGVHTAIELIASHLRKFLVDRSVLPMFEIQMASPQIDHIATPHQSWPPPQGLPPSNSAGLTYGHNQYMPPPRPLDNFYPPDMPPTIDKLPHQGISSFGREATPMGLHLSSTPQVPPSLITQITQQMQIPLSYADAVIGTAGGSISYIRRASGATVTIQETRGAPGEMTVEISGTASQVQAAQQIIQNFMAEAGSQTQTGGIAEQGYNPYSLYSSPPNAAHGGHSGNYGAHYGYLG